jgi:hypothetical protein
MSCDSNRSLANQRAYASPEECELLVSRRQILELVAISAADTLEQGPRTLTRDKTEYYRARADFELYLFGSLLPEKACRRYGQFLGWTVEKTAWHAARLGDAERQRLADLAAADL